MLMKTRKYLRL